MLGSEDVSKARSGRRSGALLLLVFLLGSGCGSLESVSSGRVGCAPSDITISDEQSGWNSATWVATCHGKRYFCSGSSAGRYGSDVDCKEER